MSRGLNLLLLVLSTYLLFKLWEAFQGEYSKDEMSIEGLRVSLKTQPSVSISKKNDDSNDNENKKKKETKSSDTQELDEDTHEIYPGDLDSSNPFIKLKLNTSLEYVQIIPRNSFSGDIFIRRQKDFDEFIYGRMIGPVIIGLKLFPCNDESFVSCEEDYFSEDETHPFPEFLWARYFLPVSGDYFLSLITTTVDRNTAFTGGLYLTKDQQQVKQSRVRGVINEKLSPELVDSIGKHLISEIFTIIPKNLTYLIDFNMFGAKPKENNKVLEVDIKFIDGRYMDYDCLQNQENELQNEQICFIGDSHTRDIVATIHDYFLNTPQITYLERHFPIKHWGSYRHCSKILYNTGQWPLSFQAMNYHKAPYYLNTFEKEITESLNNLKKIYKTGFWWMTIEPCPLLHRWDDEHRHLSSISVWNHRINSKLKPLRIPLINNFGYLASIQEFTRDGCHYGAKVNFGVISKVLETLFPQCLRFK